MGCGTNRVYVHGGHPATGKRGSTAHHKMIHPTASESGAATPPPEKFPLGQVVTTPGALDAIPQNEMQTSLRRHHSGDWGDLDEHDKLENERGLREGFRLFSAYSTKAGVRFYIITEHDRSVTTVLLPDEY